MPADISGAKMECRITHLSCETQPGETWLLTGGFQRWLELDRESNQRERRGARWMKALDPMISQTERLSFRPRWLSA